jgi:hypothetical protein
MTYHIVENLAPNKVCGLYYKHFTIVNDASRVKAQFGATLKEVNW